jgi:hypothetical protein
MTVARPAGPVLTGVDILRGRNIFRPCFFSTYTSPRKNSMNTRLSLAAGTMPRCRRIAGFPLRAVLFMLVSQFFFTGCEKKDPVSAILGDAIRQLEQQSAKWDDILTKTKADLIKAGQTAISNEVDKVLGSALGDAGATGMCGVDYLRSRAKEGLAQILAKYKKQTMIRQPHCCTPNPANIDMSLEPGRRSWIEMFGYNFDVAKDSLKIFLIDTNGNKKDVTQNSQGVSNIAFPTDYHLTLNLSGNGVALDATSKQLIFRFSENVSQTVNILQPKPIIGVAVDVHNPTVGWRGYKTDPNSEANYAGTIQQSLQIEAICIKLVNAPPSMKITYTAHFSGCGWNCAQLFPNQASNGQTAGTSDRNKWRQMEAIKIELTGAPSGAHVLYKSYIQDFGWEQPWQSDGAVSGTVGSGKRIEALCVKVEMP